MNELNVEFLPILLTNYNCMNCARNDPYKLYCSDTQDTVVQLCTLIYVQDSNVQIYSF